jgi:hypothetical protein
VSILEAITAPITAATAAVTFTSFPLPAEPLRARLGRAAPPGHTKNEDIAIQPFSREPRVGCSLNFVFVFLMWHLALILGI